MVITQILHLRRKHLEWIQRWYNKGFGKKLQKAPDYPLTELSILQKQAIRDYIEQLNENNISAKVSIIFAAANYILAKFYSDPLSKLF